MSASRAFAAFAFAAVTAAAPAAAAPVHEHGVARLDVAVEATRLTFTLATPLDNLVGFERAPRSDAERRAVDTALGLLREGGRLFKVDAAAGCRFVRVDLFSPALGTGPEAGGAAFAAAMTGHAELEATWRFDCRDGAHAARFETTLFQPFTRLQRIDGQAVTAAGAQQRFVLRRPAGVVMFAR